MAVSVANSDYRVPKGRPVAGISYPTSVEGVLVAAMKRHYGQRVVSYDGGALWRPLRVPALVSRLFATRPHGPP